MREPLPQAFAENMRAALGDEAEALLSALDGQYLRGLRLNPFKPVDLPNGIGLGEPIPWWSGDGRYLSPESDAGAHPLHEAGAYYLQEPSAMSPVAVLAPKRGERVLDLCAAPGGKSTQAASAMGGDGLLVCNEPVPSRAKILSRNIERMGVTNALVVCAEPEALARKWTDAFDAVVVDAPCSGEGMFRRHPEARAEWREDSPAGCAARQKRILTSAVNMLKSGGRLVYSTCTFNEVENDEVAKWLTEAYPCMEARGFSLPSGDGRALDAPSGRLHLYPHEVRGEGHFIALFVKSGGTTDSGAPYRPAAERLKPADKATVEAWRGFASDMSIEGISPDAMLGGALISAPELPPLDGISVLRAGLTLGTMKGKVFAPDHALAVGMSADRAGACPHIDLSPDEARAYQAGEALAVHGTMRGWALARYAGAALGFVKISDGIAKNHYPKGLRRPI